MVKVITVFHYMKEIVQHKIKWLNIAEILTIRIVLICKVNIFIYAVYSIYYNLSFYVEYY